MYALLKAGKIDKLAIVGVSRSEVYIEKIMSEVSIPTKDEKIWQQLQRAMYYFPFDFTQTEGYERLKNFLSTIEKRHGLSGNRMFYLATLPQHFVTITENVAQSKLATETGQNWRRLVYEKPFGWDLVSAKNINRAITKHFSEKQIYRIDHYLGKELVSTIPLVRFTNRILEPLWNKEHLDSVQIILHEEVGVEGRGKYYDSYGALKDMVQSHMLQLVGLVGMEVPKKLVGDDIREAKLTVLRNIKVKEVLFGQYAGYGTELGVKANSTTDTFVALHLEINTPRWRGVPFYLKTGKYLGKKESSIHLKFKMVECLLTKNCPADSNYLTLHIEPQPGLFLEMNSKASKELAQVEAVKMEFYPHHLSEAYETMLGEIVAGNQSIFVRHDEIEAAWNIVDGLKGEVYTYTIGSKGPAELKTWSKKHKLQWRA